MKTINICREHVFGTEHYVLRSRYRGVEHRWPVSGEALLGDLPNGRGPEGLRAVLKAAAGAGFTHAKFVGDWTKATKPRNGALCAMKEAQ